MVRRILITSTDLMMMQFLIPHVIHLSTHGFEVEIACSDVGGRMDSIRNELHNYVKKIYTVRLFRSPLALTNLKGYRDMKGIIDALHYDIIWTNEPVMGVVTRLAARKARKKNTKVMYMAHGFHFYSGAPLKNWILYYLIEWRCSWWTDMLVTINREDYNRAKRRMRAGRVVYVPGIGIDTNKFQSGVIDVKEKRAGLGLLDENIMVLSVGELSVRKNHEIVIRALHELKNPHVIYFICGEGKLEEDLSKLIQKLNMERQVRLLGYRVDISELCQSADLFILPSHQEGLSVALMEAIACQVPVVCSKIRGNKDIVQDYLFDENDERELIKLLKEVMTTRDNLRDVMEKSVQKNYERLKAYDLSNVLKKMLKLCETCQ